MIRATHFALAVSVLSAQPEIHPDRSVTFRIRAPKASEVLFQGDWMGRDECKPMTKDAHRVIADPINPRLKLRA